jgi:hypothetical protein
MEVKWRDNICPSPVLAQFDPSDFVREGNSISRTGRAAFGVMDAASTLLSFLDITGSQTGTAERLEIVESCIGEAGARNKLEPGFFLTELRRRLIGAEGGITHKRIVIGHISVSSSIGPVDSRRIDGVHISFGGAIARFQEEIRRVTEYAPVIKDVPSSYMPVRLSLSARSDEDAFSRTRNAIFQLLGWWNHALTYCRNKITFGGVPGPIAEIVLAPVRTVHDAKGRAGDCWHYETDFAHYPAPSCTKDQWGRLQKRESLIRAKLRGHHSREFLENLARAYYAACSCQTPDNTFLSLWTLLEVLTGTDKGETLIRRASFPISQKHCQVCGWELRHLQLCRNRLVHRGETRPDMQRLAYQLKVYVDILFNWWVFQSGTFQDRQEFLDLLDTPRDSKRLSQRIRVLRHALKHAQTAGR